MNVVAESSAFLPARADWDAILVEVNAWQGCCLHHFSTVELAVTETLLALSAASTGVGNIRLRQLIGQRLDDLSVAIGPEGPFSNVGKGAYPRLCQFREHQEAFRVLLCHGAIKVTVDLHARWTLVIRSLSIRAGQPQRGLVVIEQAEARSKLAALSRDGQRLTTALDQLRRNLPDRQPSS